MEGPGRQGSTPELTSRRGASEGGVGGQGGNHRQGGRGEGERRGAEVSGGETRTRGGSNSLPNQIKWISAEQPDHGGRCTVQHPLTEFWDGPRRAE